METPKEETQPSIELSEFGQRVKQRKTSEKTESESGIETDKDRKETLQKVRHDTEADIDEISETELSGISYTESEFSEGKTSESWKVNIARVESDSSAGQLKDDSSRAVETDNSVSTEGGKAETRDTNIPVEAKVILQLKLSSSISDGRTSEDEKQLAPSATVKFEKLPDQGLKTVSTEESDPVSYPRPSKSNRLPSEVDTPSIEIADVTEDSESEEEQDIVVPVSTNVRNRRIRMSGTDEDDFPCTGKHCCLCFAVAFVMMGLVVLFVWMTTPSASMKNISNETLDNETSFVERFTEEIIGFTGRYSISTEYTESISESTTESSTESPKE